MNVNAALARIIPRRSEQRGHANHGWLQAAHTFSFASYRDPKHDKFGCLRVINEDRIAGNKGFGEHSHAEFEIFTYLIEGQVEHKDSMGNTEIISRGDIQLTSAGTGISHSETAHGPNPVHLLQIWSIPSTRRLQPKYYTRHFPDSAKEDKWVRVVAPVHAEGVKAVRDLEEGEDLSPAPVHSPLSMYATLLNAGKVVTQGVKGTKAYIHLAQTSGYNPDEASTEGARIKVKVGLAEEELGEGDGAYISIPGDGLKDLVVENVGSKRAEVVLFDIEA